MAAPAHESAPMPPAPTPDSKAQMSRRGAVVRS
jgi:hypothetical protein